ncbi:MAG TPA: hypothetical protein VN649_18470 [Ramlibacter sp.]|nr:hypothetical protein [Ramlibacter sp.]
MPRFVPMVLCAMISTAFAGQEPLTANPGITVDFGGAVLSGAGRLIHATNVPVFVGGNPAFYNADFEFQILGDGRFAAIITSASLASGPATIPSTSPLNFLPGTYTLNSCAYTLGNPSIGQNGARIYTIVKVVAACAPGGGIEDSYSWSTLPATQNTFVTATPAQAASFPADFAWGVDGRGIPVRAFTTGSTITVGDYSNTTGQAVGAQVTFVKQ